MKRIITILFFSISTLLSSSIDVVELYRYEGIQAVEKMIEERLKDKNYWDEKLQYKDISHGYYESIQYVMICQKGFKEISLYDTKSQQKLFSSSVFVGKVEGDKKVEGDLKTPVGAYKLTQRLTNLDPFYGPLALTTNYPNIYDRINGKTGHGIWIHGLPEKEERDDFTQGCIALDNNKIKDLDNSINIDNSILVISEKQFQTVLKEDITLILSSIFQWRDAWKYSDIDGYLSFYDESFKRVNGQNYEQFSRFKKRIFNKEEKKTIEFSNINIVPYPNDKQKNIFKVIMDEYYKTSSYKFVGKKELYVEILNGKFKILTES